MTPFRRLSTFLKDKLGPHKTPSSKQPTDEPGKRKHRSGPEKSKEKKTKADAKETADTEKGNDMSKPAKADKSGKREKRKHRSRSKKGAKKESGTEDKHTGSGQLKTPGDAENKDIDAKFRENATESATQNVEKSVEKIKHDEAATAVRADGQTAGEDPIYFEDSDKEAVSKAVENALQNVDTAPGMVKTDYDMDAALAAIDAGDATDENGSRVTIFNVKSMKMEEKKKKKEKKEKTSKGKKKTSKGKFSIQRRISYSLSSG